VSPSNVNLAELIALLIQEEGMTPQDAATAATAAMRAQGKLARGQQGGLNLQSPQAPDGRSVDYGDETPEEAKERWYRQEANDPQGLFAGGATAGGVFGDGPISTDLNDPGAQARTISMQAQMSQLQTQSEMVKLLAEMRRSLNAPTEQKQLPPQQKGFRRLLGRKKRR